jgi:triphosphoribosyl-dephospho-CoA synthase
MIDSARAGSAERVAAADVAIAAQLACMLEATAAKPGNVSPGRPFDDLRYEDFLASAAAIAVPFASAAARPLGSTVRLAIEATARWSRSNTNLGIVLLLAPIARAALLENAERGMNRGLRDGVRAVIEATTIDDARDVYAAIRLASPGGLGRVDEQDIADEPTCTLLEVMRLAAARDAIAREYATGFELTFLTAVPALARARRDGLTWNDATRETFLMLLAAQPDTHISRRGGTDLASSVSRRARAVIESGGVRSPAGRDALEAMDRALRDGRHLANPGTTADLTAAAIFVVLLRGGWHGAPEALPAKGGCDAASR